MGRMEQPHVVLHPLPVQGHIKPLLCLAQLISEAGVYVSFVVTQHTCKRLENLPALTAQFPNLHFEPISDGLPEDHPRTLTFDYFVDIKTKSKPPFKDLLLSLDTKSENGLSPPVTCIINDGYLTYPFEVAEELKIPMFTFIAHSACFLLTYYSIPKLIQEGHLPFADDNMNLEINGVAGLEGILRRKNLPPACMMKEIVTPLFQLYLNETLAMNRTSGLIINTFDDLEVQCLPHVANNFSKVYSVGPLHAFLNSKIGNIRSQMMASHASLWKAEQNCIAWLDSQPLKSVVYVSCGTLAKISISQLLEFWHGLVNSGHPFLWVIHPDVVLEEERDKNIIPEELQKGPKENGYIVDWAPQEEVLAHKAVGGFFTHCGWNSVLESIIARIPLICWPYISDQNINADLVSNVLRIGIELEGCDRSTIESTIRALMDCGKDEFQKSIDEVAKCGLDGIGHGGSSSQNLKILVEDIKKIMNLK